MTATKKYLVIVYTPDKNTIVSGVLGNLGAAMRTADAYPTRPSVILSGSVTMLNHAKEALSLPSQKWMSTKIFVAHTSTIAKLFDFKTEVIQNVTSWDIKKALE